MEPLDLKEGLVRANMRIGKSCVCVCPVGNGISKKMAGREGRTAWRVSGSRRGEKRPLLPIGGNSTELLVSVGPGSHPLVKGSEAAQSSSGCLCSFVELQASGSWRGGIKWRMRILMSQEFCGIEAAFIWACQSPWWPPSFWARPSVKTPVRGTDPT